MSKSPFRFTKSESFDRLFVRNQEWARRLNSANPGLLAANARGQKPRIFWIGCADSRAGEGCLDLLPGEVFVHRNVANMVPNCDPSSQSALQLAMQVVGCEYIIVCGHTDCKGIETTLRSTRVGGSLEAWLRNLRDVRAKYSKELFALADEESRKSRLAELNVIEQVYNVRTNDIVREHIKSRGVEVYGVVYDCATGHLKLLDIPEDKNIGHYAVD